ncbi:MAG: HAMP domain-containing sensor histidine kinase, partial [Treponemataceae bacterium]
MKIRTQFYILTAGIVVVPLLAIGIFYGIEKVRERNMYPVPAYEDMSKLFGGNLRREEWEGLAVFIEHRKPNMNFTVLRGDRRVVYSTTTDFPSGSELSDAALMDIVRKTSDRYSYVFDSLIRQSDEKSLVLMRFEREVYGPPNPFAKLFGYLVALFGVVFFFSAAMSVFIARSITQSVTKLDAATRRIAAGELDLAVEAHGSNEITSLTDSLNRMRLALKDDQSRRARFIMGVTHDLKTPLALIKGYAEAIGDGMADDAESREKSVAIIGSKVDQLEGMIDDLIEFVKVDTGEWRRHLDRVALGPFLTNYGKRFADDAELLDRRPEVNVDIPAYISVPMDERLAMRALENLINNSLRYTEKGGTVRLFAHVDSNSEGRLVLIEISDDGPGIDELDLPRIFDPFFRGTSSRREPGMGLGLSVVKGVVDSHGWDIAVKSKKGEG